MDAYRKTVLLVRNKLFTIIQYPFCILLGRSVVQSRRLSIYRPFTRFQLPMTSPLHELLRSMSILTVSIIWDFWNQQLKVTNLLQKLGPTVPPGWNVQRPSEVYLWEAELNVSWGSVRHCWSKCHDEVFAAGRKITTLNVTFLWFND